MVGSWLPGRADGYPSGPPQTRTCAMHAYGSSGRAPAALPQSTGLPWSGGVSATALPCLPPADALPDVAFPSVGRLGLTSPPATVLCNATTASWPSRGPSLVARSPIPCVLPLFVVSRMGSPPGGSPRTTPGPLVTRSPLPGIAHGDRWLSHVPELPLWTHAPLSDPGGVLDTRHNASRTAAFRRLQTVGFPLCTAWRAILLSTTIHISGLNHAACLLATPGFVRPLAGRHAGSLLTGWLDCSQGGLEPYWLAPTGEQQPIS